IFGGVSSLDREPEKPRDEFLIAFVGPLTSFALAALFWALREALAPGDSPLDAVLGYLAFINLLLGAFNLLPGFPLDGGRVLRSIVWAVTGSLRRGTEIASYVGQGFGFLLIFWGVWRIFAGDVLGGVWIAFIGWFLNSAAESTRQSQVVSERLRGLRVAELMNPQPHTSSPAMTAQEFVFDHVMRHGERAVLVVDQGRLLGIVSITDASKVPHEAWVRTPIGAIMTPVPLKTVSPETDVSTALQLMVRDSLNQLPVLHDGQI